MLGSQLRLVADNFGIEGGFSIAMLIQEMTAKYIPVLDHGVTLSPAATKDRTRLYTLHSLDINVDGSDVLVNSPGFGITSGTVNTQIPIPGLAANATVRVVGSTPWLSAKWATAPSMSFGHVAHSLKTTGLNALRTLSTAPGVLSEETRMMLMEVINTHPVYGEVVVASAILLTNAVVEASIR
jgi:hypothetical protein